MNVHVTGTVANIQSAFHVNMNSYQHDTENRTFFSADREPTVDLPVSLWHVAGLDNYSIPHPAGLTRNANANLKPKATTGSGPSASFLGSDMRAAYYGGTLTGRGQSLGLLEYYGTDLADLTTYFTNAGQTNNVPVTLLSTDGTSTSCVYRELRRHRADARHDAGDRHGAGLSSLVMYIGSTDSAIFNAMATHSPLNAQLSSSWTWNPADPSTDDPYFKEFAAQGQNLFQAAGDSGKWTTSGTGSEIYPADDVYVTTVGGTDLDTSSAAGTGPLKPHGSMAAAASRPTSTRFLRGKPPQPPDARAAPRPIATDLTFQPMQTSLSTFAPTRPPAPPTITAAPVLRLPCGPATWRSSISSRWPMATRRSASSIRAFTPSAKAPLTTPTSTTSPAAAMATRPRRDTTWPPAGEAPMVQVC